MQNLDSALKDFFVLENPYTAVKSLSLNIKQSPLNITKVWQTQNFQLLLFEEILKTYETLDNLTEPSLDYTVALLELLIELSESETVCIDFINLNLIKYLQWFFLLGSKEEEKTEEKKSEEKKTEEKKSEERILKFLALKLLKNIFVKIPQQFVKKHFDREFLGVLFEICKVSNMKCKKVVFFLFTGFMKVKESREFIYKYRDRCTAIAELFIKMLVEAIDEREIKAIEIIFRMFDYIVEENKTKGFLEPRFFNILDKEKFKEFFSKSPAVEEKINSMKKSVMLNYRRGQ